MSQSEMANTRSPLLFSLSRVRSPSLENLQVIPYSTEKPFEPLPTNIRGAILSRDLMSPRLKLHHPTNRSPSAHRSSMPINPVGGAKRTSSSSFCTTPYARIPRIGSALPSSGAPRRCTRRTCMVSTVLRCLWWPY